MGWADAQGGTSGFRRAQGSAGTGFAAAQGRGGSGDPLTIFGSALLAWWDFSDISTLWQTADASTTPVSANGQTILAATDKSGNGVTISDAAAGPVYTTGGPNGLSVATFASAEFLAGTLSQAAPFTVFVANSYTTAQENRVVTVAAGEGLFEDPVGNDVSMTLTSKVEGSVSGVLAFAVYTWLGDGASSLIRKDGASIASGDIGAGGIDLIRLGADTDNGGGLAGAIGECFICSGDQTAKFASAESYLGRWT